MRRWTIFALPERLHWDERSVNMGQARYPIEVVALEL